MTNIGDVQISFCKKKQSYHGLGDLKITEICFLWFLEAEKSKIKIVSYKINKY